MNNPAAVSGRRMARAPSTSVADWRRGASESECVVRCAPCECDVPCAPPWLLRVPSLRLRVAARAHRHQSAPRHLHHRHRRRRRSTTIAATVIAGRNPKTRHVARAPTFSRAAPRVPSPPRMASIPVTCGLTCARITSEFLGCSPSSTLRSSRAETAMRDCPVTRSSFIARETVRVSTGISICCRPRYPPDSPRDTWTDAVAVVGWIIYIYIYIYIYILSLEPGSLCRRETTRHVVGY